MATLDDAALSIPTATLGVDVANSTDDRGRIPRAGMRRLVQELDDGDLGVIYRALRTFIADAERWSAAPHEDIGRAHVLLRRLEEAGVR